MTKQEFLRRFDASKRLGHAYARANGAYAFRIARAEDALQAVIPAGLSRPQFFAEAVLQVEFNAINSPLFDAFYGDLLGNLNRGWRNLGFIELWGIVEGAFEYFLRRKSAPETHRID